MPAVKLLSVHFDKNNQGIFKHLIIMQKQTKRKN